ncbi:hypothetical protein Celaphus_00018768 [Cervus elaphus hippelaphus]|uniref:Uncharacterized protein n=1 Tax=Cervus elaphus hippelaphus TaxID=46360 RepID=A0A212C5M0_CEREH|nr:hypothetical protein Celaphus_00018768 [Cervus elaphus hippelaphus]
MNLWSSYKLTAGAVSMQVKRYSNVSALASAIDISLLKGEGTSMTGIFASSHWWYTKLLESSIELDYHV